MRLTWLGHSSVLVETGGLRVLADPVLRSRAGALRRAVPLPPVVERLRDGDGVDAIVVSHLHHDHCDLPTLRRLAPPVLLVPPGAAAWMSAHGVPGAVELAPGEAWDLGGGARIVATEADHDGRRQPWGPRAGSVGHLVESEAACAWLAGDTGWFEGLAGVPRLAKRGRIDVAAVPVAGWGPRLGRGHLDPAGAARAVATVAARAAVPVHWGTLHLAALRGATRGHLESAGPRFRDAARRLAPDTDVRVLPVGGTLTVG